MAEDSTPTPDGQQPDPMGTQAAPVGDTGQNTPAPQQPIDWEARYKAEQAKISQQALEIRAREERIAELEAAGTDEPDDGGQPAPQRRGGPTRRELELEEELDRARWQQAEAIYGGDVMKAYGKFASLTAADATPTGWLTALEAYHEARSEGATPVQAQAQAAQPLPTREQATQPQVDSNRTDVGSASTNTLEEARRKGDLEAYVAEKWRQGLEAISKR